VTPTELRLQAYRTAFRVYGRISPHRAARAAVSLWLTVPRRSVRARRQRALPRGLQFGVKVDGGVVRGTRWGSGPLVYLVHGWAGSSAQFASVVEALVAAGFCPVAFDAPNHGRSGPGPSGRRHTHAIEFARALAGVVHRHGAAYAVVAHSLGAVATGLAVRSGWVSVPRLVLVSPVTEIGGQLDYLAERLDLPHRVRAQLDAQVQARTGRPVNDFRLDRTLEQMAETPVLVIDDRGDREILDDPEVGRAVTRFLEHTRLRAVS
jgi:pimeloyl-ACP methyl ester carboxylesterase